jgi:hypothetical protein
MKPIIRIPILLLAFLAILLLAGCVPIPMVSMDQGLVIGQSYRLESGQTLNHDLTVIGGNATLESKSTVNGSVSVIGGNVTIDGMVNGDVSVIGSDVSLGEQAVVQGSVDTVGGTVRKASGAVVQGQSVGKNPSIPRITTLQTPAMNMSFDPITGPLMAIFQSLALAALAIVVNLFAPRPMDRTGQAAQANPTTAGGVGCLTFLVLIIMTLTLILIPISLLGFLVMGVASLFGWLALGLIVGRRIAVLLQQPWSDPVNAGVGTLAITLLASLLNIIPCIGWIGGALAGLVGLGAAVLTRFGTQVYPNPNGSAATVVHSGPYSPPPPPVWAAPRPEPGARVYPPESDQPGGTPPAGPDEGNNI